MDEPVQVGPFDLEGRLGEGGMGVIYRSVHRDTDVPAAVKVIRRAADDAAQRRFHAEVQAHAGLQHPSIVYLYEYGTIGSDAARASDGELHAGDPFVAMELADGGTIRDSMPFDSWMAVRRILVQILDALAYAHARGVVHRDLKPENLLVFSTDGAGSEDRRVKLADFGIAHAFGGERETDTGRLESAAGTPLYMAPEQFRAAWRRYGPWTDLYALGCVAWELVCGRPPFRGDHPFQLALSHERESRPALDPQFPVPDELEPWIHRAMTPDPELRFRRAADAAWALPTALLDDGDRAEERPVPPNRAKRGEKTEGSTLAAWATRTMNLGPTITMHTHERTPPAEEFARVDGLSGTEEDGADPGGLFAAGRPPVPEDWRPEQLGSLPGPPVGAGLGLFGLREPPFVNREGECDRVWDRLREVDERETLGTVFLVGEAGTGKSRLAEWIVNRAHEEGAAEVLRTFHTESGGPNEGLRGALERALRCVKLERGELYDYLLDSLPSDDPGEEEWLERDARALTEYLRPTDDEADGVDGPAYRFASSEQKSALLARILGRLARRRPVLLWLDDLQWGSGALRLLEYLHERSGEEVGLLVLATVRSDVVAERPRLRDRLEELRERPLSAYLQLPPLSRDYQRELILEMLPLEDDLAETLAERTEGHPLFAMQLLGHWIESDAIELASQGYRVPEGRELALPEDIHELWLRRLDRLVDDLEVESRETARPAIERAAVLGRDVDDGEWGAVCVQLGLDRPDRIRDGLVERGLAEPTDTGWAFAHGLLVESLERLARDEGRWREHNRKCAELLEQLSPDQPKTTAARRADHWVAAGELENALEPLEEEWDRLIKTGRPRVAKQTVQRREEILEELGVSDQAPRRIENDLMVVTTERLLGSPRDSNFPLAEDARERAEQIGAERLLATACREIAANQRGSGEFEKARRTAQQATRHARRADDVQQLGRALIQSGWMYYFESNLEEAEACFSEVYELAVDSGNRFRRLQAQINSAWVALSRGDEQRAAQIFEESLAECREAGYRVIELRCLNGLGDLARLEGSVVEARARYRRYGQLGREIDNRKAVANAQLNLTLVELMAGRFDEAGEKLEIARRRNREVDLEDAYIHIFRLSRMTRAAGLGEWSRVDDRLSSYEDSWLDPSNLKADHPWLLELAGDYAAEAGEDDRAERIWQLARDLWDRLDNAGARDRVDDKLAD